MSKDFDTTLSDALDLAAEAAQTPGPAAARIRGGERARRRRVAATAGSLALVALATTVAFKAVPSHGDTSPVASSSTKVSVKATGSAATSVNESMLTASGTASADPHKVTPVAWLTAIQLPFAETFHWQVQQASSQGSPIGEPLTPSVFYVANDTSLQSLTICSDPSWLLPHTTGAQHSEYLATTGGGNNQASQYLFFFADHNAAQWTFNNLVKQYSAIPGCQQPGAARPTLVAGNIDSPRPPANEMAWLTVKGASSTPDLPDYTREYFVVRGTVIAYVAVTSYTDTSLPTAYSDEAQLSTLASHLCVYKGACS